MKKIVSVLLIITMMLASLIAVIPTSAASNETEVITLLPEGLMDEVDTTIKSDKASRYAPYSPYVYTGNAVNNKISGSKLLSISIPVYDVGAADNGNFYFTLYVIKSSKIQQIAAPEDITKYRITVKGSDYGLTAGTEVHKVIKVDLRSYNINVGEDETLTFYDKTDTIVPTWASNKESALYKLLESKAAYSFGFACYAGQQGYGANSAAIVYDLELEREKAAPAEDLDFTTFETRTLFTDKVYEGIKTLYEADGAGTLNWQPSVAPFTPTNSLFQRMMAGTRLRSLTLPINSTEDVDSEGNLIFTLSTWKGDNLTSASGKVKEWKLKIKPSDYGLSAKQKDIYKFIKIDLTSYNIVIAKDEVIAFSANGDTLIPGYSGAATNYFKTNFPAMNGFGACTGTTKMPENTWPDSTVFFDIEYDVPVSESYLQLSGLYNEVKGYAQADFTSGWAEFKTAFDAAEKKMNTSSDTADFTTEYNALKAACDALVVNTAINRSALTTAINRANRYEGKAANYSADTWAAMQAALTTANAVLTKDDLKQSEINSAAEALNAAIDALVEVGSIPDLSAKISEIETNYPRDSYTTTSYKNLIDALSEAKAIVDGEFASKDVVDGAMAALDEAVKELVKRADFTEINALVEKYEGITDAEYFPEGVVALMEVIKEVKNARKPGNAAKLSEDDGEKLLKELKAAIDALKKYADFTEIDAKLAEVNALNKDDYTAESWKTLNGVMTSIDALKKNANATDDQVQALLTALNAAVEGLIKVDTPTTDGEATDDAKQDSDTSADDDTAADGDDGEGAENKGCGSTVGAGALIAMLTMAIGCTTLIKKKEN